MLKTLRFKYSVLLGIYALLDKLFSVLQRPTHQSNLTTNRGKWNFCLYGLECKLVRIGWFIHFRIIKNTYFVYLETLTMLANNTINNFSTIPNIIL